MVFSKQHGWGRNRNLNFDIVYLIIYLFSFAFDYQLSIHQNAIVVNIKKLFIARCLKMNKKLHMKEQTNK